MLDPKLLREDIVRVAKQLKTRGFELDEKAFHELEQQRKSLQVETEHLQQQRNQQAKQIGQAKAKGESIEALLKQGEDLGQQLKQQQEALHEVQRALHDFCAHIPNLPHESVPVGHDEKANAVVREWGEKPSFGFTPKEHTELVADQLDFATASKLSGSRFVVLRRNVARLHRALAQFMLDLHVQEHGYEEVYVPYLVSSACLEGTSQLPKFEEDQFAVKDTDLWLIPTAEVAVTNMVRESIVEPDQLPLKWVCHSPCFRKEAGSYGKDIKGLIRQHQFDKVEMVQIVHPEQSYQALDEMCGHAEKVLQALQLPYRVLTLCTGDMGFSATKTYDLEVWLPGQQQYREISSCSNTESFQARRMQARFRDPNTHKPDFVHTLNGSGIAVGRALVAILENYQDEQGRVRVPDVLQSYLGGIKFL